MPVAYAFMAFLLLFVVAKMYLDIAHGVQQPLRLTVAGSGRSGVREMLRRPT